ncbi:MAG: S24/S26 family peptidase [Clostridia bacterium]|nr:S24/S26 family peptidase [Clostridia bacterium]
MNKRVSLDDIAPIIRETLENDGEVSFISSGTSMLPTLRDRRDTVTLIKPPEKLKKGDVPFYQRDDGRYVLHRVIYTNDSDGTYVMRGDNQWTNEYNIRHDQIIGVLSEITRNGRKYSVDSRKYRLYVSLLPVIRFLRKSYYWFKSKVYAFIMQFKKR